MAASAETETSAETRWADEASTPQLAGSRITLSRRLLLGAAAVAALVVTAIAVVLLTAGGGPLDTKSFTAEVVAMPNGSGGISIGGDTLWSIGNQRLIPVQDGKAAKAMAVDSQADSFAADGNDLWVAFDEGVQRYDAAKRRPLGGMIDVDVSDDTKMAVGLGGVWVSYPVGNTVVRIDPATSRPGRPIHIPAGVGGPIGIGEGRLWVTNAEFGDPGGLFVTPVDERGRVERAIRLDGSREDTAPAVAAGGGSVWVGDPSVDAIRRIDPATHRVSPERIRLAGGSVAMEFAHGALFALDGAGENMLIVDPAKAQATGPAIPVAAGDHGDIAVDDGSVWVSNLNRLSLLRLSW